MSDIENPLDIYNPEHGNKARELINIINNIGKLPSNVLEGRLKEKGINYDDFIISAFDFNASLLNNTTRLSALNIFLESEEEVKKNFDQAEQDSLSMTRVIISLERRGLEMEEIRAAYENGKAIIEEIIHLIKESCPESSYRITEHPLPLPSIMGKIEVIFKDKDLKER